MPNYTFFFENKQYLNYNKNYDLLKTSENYRILNSDMAQQILKEVDKNFKSFFSLLKLAQKGECDYKACKYHITYLKMVLLHLLLVWLESKEINLYCLIQIYIVKVIHQ